MWCHKLHEDAASHNPNLPEVFPMSQKLTKATVAKLTLAPGETERFWWDADLPGFGLRARAGGAPTYVYQYKLGSKHRRMTLGRASALDPAQARNIAGELHAKVRLGQDPAATKAEARARADETLGACIKGYLAWQRNRLRPDSIRHAAKYLERDFRALHGLPLTSIGRRDVATAVGKITARGSPVAANRARATLSAFFNWAVREGIVESNPAAMGNKNEEKSRDRVLAIDELAVIWKALSKDDFGTILRLLILTGQRAREIGDLRWDEIDLDRSIILLPEHRTKNGKRHVVPLSPPARAILAAWPHQEGRDFLFGQTEHRGYTGWWEAKGRLDVKIPPWTIHDLRRSTATGMIALGVMPHVVEAVLNHIGGHRGGVAGVYNRHSYAAETAMALNRWADHLIGVIEGKKSTVTPLRAAS
jgi:integrase